MKAAMGNMGAAKAQANSKKKKKSTPSAAPGGGPLPTPPGLKSKNARSAALRNTTPFLSGQAATLLQGEPHKGDMWTAWREIQLQTQTMQDLEERLQVSCYALSIDPLQVLVAIDNKLAANAVM